jgi:hypothetical protein
LSEPEAVVAAQVKRDEASSQSTSVVSVYNKKEARGDKGNRLTYPDDASCAFRHSRRMPVSRNPQSAIAAT